MKKLMSVLVVVGGLFCSSISFALTPAELRTMVTEAHEAYRWGELEKAMELCNELIKADPNYAAAYAVRAVVQYNLAQDIDSAIDNAMNDVDKATSLPSDGYLIDVAYFWLAKLSLEYFEDPQASLEHITSAIELTRDDPFSDYFEFRSEIYKTLGNMELSAQDKAKADALRAVAK